jgi:hypothetical protein
MDRRRAAGLFVRLFAAGAEGNREGAGAALLRRDGSSDVVTAPQGPAGLVADNGFRELIAAVDDDAVALLGYARQNSARPQCLPEPQPVEIESTVAVFDGNVVNARALTSDLGLAGEEAANLIVRLINMALAECRGYDAAAVASTRLRLLNGAFSFVAWDRRLPESLLVGRNNRDLEFYRDGADGPAYVSNRRGLLGKVFGVRVATVFPDNEVRLYRPERAAFRRAKIFPHTPLRAHPTGRSRPATGVRR